MGPSEAKSLLDDYAVSVDLTHPEIVPYPDRTQVIASRRLIAHQADVPVLLSAMRAKPDWLLTHNTKHFTRVVAERASLQIGTPADFFRVLAGIPGLGL